MKKRILAPLALLLMPLVVLASEHEAVSEETATIATVAVDTVTADESAAAQLAAVEVAAAEVPVSEQDDGLNSDLAPVYKMPVWVERVESFCPWKSKDGEGYVRVVRTERHGRHQLFLQWIQKGGTSATDKVLSTRSVEELEKDYIVRLEMPKAMLNPKSCELTTMADSLNNSQRFRFKVVLREPGNYMLQVTQVLGTAEI